MTFKESNRRYENWLAKHLQVVRTDLLLKHEEMADSPFKFLRATFFRWSELWLEHFKDLSAGPQPLAVGDLHIENFGTWRDAEGRLVWGINDFDEAYRMPYAIDLIRLAVSVKIASDLEHLKIEVDDAIEAIVGGYRAGLESGGRPFVLEEDHDWLRKIATGELRSPEAFWEKMAKTLQNSGKIPASARRMLKHAMPNPRLVLRFAPRVAGLGSLGRTRFVGVGTWCGGNIAREVKALAPSAYCLALGKNETRIFYEKIITGAFRVPDPFLSLPQRSIIRRLAPHCTKIELDSLPRKPDEVRLLESMGFEIANIHLGTMDAKTLLKDLNHRRMRYFRGAVALMSELTLADWESWRKRKK
jgi:hypothetical protein